MISPEEVNPSSSPAQIKVIRVAASARKQVVFKLTDSDGKVVDLRNEVPNPPAPTPQFGTQAPAVGAHVTVKLRAKAGDLYGPTAIDIVGTILPDTGYVEFLLTEAHTTRPGLYEATIARFTVGDYLVDAWPVYILVEPNAFSQLTGSGPLTIPEIRFALMDLSNANGGAPFSNLLDDNEFQDIDLIFAMRRVVDKWNETPPPVCVYSPYNFPYRYWWLTGTCAHLLQMSAMRYRRNRLAYSAGGVSVDDQSKADEYEAKGNDLMERFDAWMLKEKTRINMDYCWGVGL